MPWVGLKPTIPAAERAKTVHASDRATTLTRLFLAIPMNNSEGSISWPISVDVTFRVRNRSAPTLAEVPKSAYSMSYRADVAPVSALLNPFFLFYRERCSYGINVPWSTWASSSPPSPHLTSEPIHKFSWNLLRASSLQRRNHLQIISFPSWRTAI
jgi:hypothetical protein